MKLDLRTRAGQAQVFRLGQVIGVLRMSAGELEEHVAEVARDNPLLEVRGRGPRRMGAGSVTDLLEMTAVEAASSLYDHVLRQLTGLMSQGAKVERLVMALVEELEPSGWLGRPLAEIAEAAGVSENTLGIALTLVQKRVEPAGLFARGLEECLRLQLEDRGLLCADMALVLRNLGALQEGGLGALCDVTGLSEDRAGALLSAIRRLDPKPGAGFCADPALMREPDARIVASDNGWKVEIRSGSDVAVATGARAGGSDRMREAMAQARALKQALDLRRSAMEQVLRALVARQGGYFRDGPEALCPLTMSELAEATGFHLSTVSRVLNGLLIEGPNGIVEARTLCAGAAGPDGGLSRPRVEARIRALIGTERAEVPLSDGRIAALLEAEGLTVSRRVVAKYRQAMGFPVAAARRRARGGRVVRLGGSARSM